MITLAFLTLVADIIAKVAPASHQLSAALVFRESRLSMGFKCCTKLNHALNAVMISLAITSALALVSLGSTTSFNAQLRPQLFR